MPLKTGSLLLGLLLIELDYSVPHTTNRVECHTHENEYGAFHTSKDEESHDLQCHNKHSILKNVFYIKHILVSPIKYQESGSLE